jgi:opacity protein-like surface antigen
MKKFILAALMVLGVISTASTANAQSVVDLFGKSYVTGSVGKSLINDGKKMDRTEYSVAFGHEFASFLRGEIAYDYLDKKTSPKTSYGQAFMVNGIYQYQVPGTIFTPYALVGAGYGQKNFGNGEYVYNYGAGVRTEITKSIDFDVRAKRIQNLNLGNFNTTSFHSDIVTAGVSYKF